jgi:predicted nucleic acid-binding protein
MFFADTDILSTFAKADATKYLKELCKELNISPSVYEELMRAKHAGYSFVDEILRNTEIILLSEDEFKDFRNLLESRKDLHEGECQLIVLCKSRNGILLTNDRFVKKFCIKSNINFLDLEDLLRALKLRKILKHDELKKLIEDIEKKDLTIIKSKEDILGD